MEKLRTPVLIESVYLILLGLANLSLSLVSSIFGYEVKDPGLLRVLSGTFLAFGVVVWAVASNVEKYGGLATALSTGLVIATVFLLWGWVGGLFTTRNALVPFIINRFGGLDLDGEAEGLTGQSAAITPPPRAIGIDPGRCSFPATYSDCARPEPIPKTSVIAASGDAP